MCQDFINIFTLKKGTFTQITFNYVIVSGMSDFFLKVAENLAILGY
jgi:hypothetical protein